MLIAVDIFHQVVAGRPYTRLDNIYGSTANSRRRPSTVIRAVQLRGDIMSVQIEKLSHALGAEIRGIDLSKRLSEKDLDAIHKAFLEYSVLLFRGQALTR